MTYKHQAQNVASQLSEVAHGAENFLRWSSSAMLRGGQVTKFKGEAASCSPETGLVTVGTRLGEAAGGGSSTLTLGLARRLLHWSVAPIALLAAALPAFAQDERVEFNPNQFVCEDSGVPVIGEQGISGDGGVVTAMTSTFATNQVSYRNRPTDTYAHIEAGAALDTEGPLSGFFQVESDLSQDYTSFGGKVGVRIRF
ncbi:MAG: hypothetical protein AAGK02_05930 [Pseudomonadota bacterium]